METREITAENLGTVLLIDDIKTLVGKDLFNAPTFLRRLTPDAIGLYPLGDCLSIIPEKTPEGETKYTGGCHSCAFLRSHEPSYISIDSQLKEAGL